MELEIDVDTVIEGIEEKPRNLKKSFQMDDVFYFVFKDHFKMSVSKVDVRYYFGNKPIEIYARRHNSFTKYQPEQHKIDCCVVNCDGAKRNHLYHLLQQKCSGLTFVAEDFSKNYSSASSAGA